jgi:hypothetical protein
MEVLMEQLITPDPTAVMEVHMVAMEVHMAAMEVQMAVHMAAATTGVLTGLAQAKKLPRSTPPSPIPQLLAHQHRPQLPVFLLSRLLLSLHP